MFVCVSVIFFIFPVPHSNVSDIKLNRAVMSNSFFCETLEEGGGTDGEGEVGYEVCLTLICIPLIVK